eukprot:gb/GECG01008341.1/.p1 GENE.gb/GECG01008341.1/~~gb/GECG01008341.1/.p1  ORF type:complete len:123 (+),score=4.54 gb/GECG01008341.1/:1-369(+)
MYVIEVVQSQLRCLALVQTRTYVPKDTIGEITNYNELVARHWMHNRLCVIPIFSRRNYLFVADVSTISSMRCSTGTLASPSHLVALISIFSDMRFSVSCNISANSFAISSILCFIASISSSF